MKEKLFEEIERIPKFERKEIYVDGEKQKSFDAILEEGAKQAIAVVSKRYTLVQIRDVFRRIAEVLPEDAKGEVIYYWGKGLFFIFPPVGKVGARVMNSVDGSTSLRMDFVYVSPLGNLYLPRDVAGVRKIHVGRVESTFGDIVETLNKVQHTWTNIVENLSRTEATSEDLDEIKKIAGKKCAKTLEAFYAETEASGRKPTVS